MRGGCLCLLAVGCCALAYAQPAAAPGPQYAAATSGAPAPAAALAAAPAAAATQLELRTMVPFNRVALCAPFTILVEPASSFQLAVDAEAAVRSAITTLVDTGTLLIQASAYSAAYPVKVCHLYTVAFTLWPLHCGLYTVALHRGLI